MPLAHCWNDVPEMQLNIPSLVQAPVRAPDEEVVEDEEEEEEELPVPVAAGAEVATVGTLMAVVATAGTTSAGEVADVAELAEASGLPLKLEMLTNTPPGREVGLDAGAVPTETVGAVPTETGEVAPPAAAPPVVFGEVALPVAAAQLPVGAAVAVEVAPPSNSTESPGLGKTTSKESAVPQPSPILATNMLGRAL